MIRLAIICGLLANLAGAATVTNFYVDSTVGSSGSGTLASPWKALTDINWSPINTNLLNGTNVNLNMKRGSSWTGTMTIGTVGSSTFIVQPYSDGAAPKLQNVHISNSTNVVMWGLRFTNSAPNQAVLVDGANSSFSLYYCLFERLEAGLVGMLVNAGGGNSRIINCTFTGCSAQEFINQSAAAVIGITNCVFSGYDNGLNQGNQGVKSTAGTVILDHCLVMENGKGLSFRTTGVTEYNTIYGEPRYLQTRQKGIVCLTEDDSQTVADWLITADMATNYGFRTSFYVTTGPAVNLSDVNYTNVQIRLNAGHEVGAHSTDHPDLADTTALNIQYVGAGSACTMTISASNLTTTCTGDAGNNLNLDLSSSTYSNLTALVTHIDGLAAYVATNVSPSFWNGNVPSWLLTNVTAVDIKTSLYTNYFDRTRFLNYEVDTNIATLNSRFTNYTCLTMAYPNGAYNNALEQYLTNNTALLGCRLATAPPQGSWRLRTNEIYEVSSAPGFITLIEAIQFENSVSDSSGLGNTFTANNLTYSSVGPYRGTYSGSFNGTTAYLNRADDADFDFSGGDFDVSGYFSPSGSGVRTIYSQGTDANNKCELYIDGNGAVHFDVWSGGVQSIFLSTTNGAITNGGWQAIAVAQEFGRTLLRINHRINVQTNTAARLANYTGSEYIGSDYNFAASAQTNFYSGLMDNFAADTGIYFNVLSLCDLACEEGTVFAIYHHGEIATPRSVDGVILDAFKDYSAYNANLMVLPFLGAVQYIRTNGTVQADGMTYYSSPSESPNYRPKIDSVLSHTALASAVAGPASMTDLNETPITDSSGAALLTSLTAGAFQNGNVYYVSQSGNNANPGTLAAPWQTTYYASTNVLPGDTVLVQPGIYNERPSFTISGNPSNHITFRANGAVTNQGTWQVNASSLTIDGFEFTSRGTIAGNGQAILLDTNISDVWIINNQFHDNPGGNYLAAIEAKTISGIGGVCLSSSILISNNYIHDWSALSDAVITADGGTNWLIVNNMVSNTFGSDFVRLWGGSHIVRGNVVKAFGSEIARIEGAGNAAFNGAYFYNNSYTTNIAGGGIAFTNAAGYLLIEWPASDWAANGYTNKWNLVNSTRSITYAAALTVAGTWTMYDATIVSAPTGGQGLADHPDIVQTWGSYVFTTNTTYYPLLQCTNMLFENNWIEGNFLGSLGQINCNSGTQSPPAVHDITFRNNVFINLKNGSLDCYNLKYYNNTFFRCGADPNSPNTPLTCGFYDPSSSSPNGECFGFECTNNAFIACGYGVSNQGWYGAAIVKPNGGPYAPDLVSNFYTHCDYNYVCNDTNTFAQKAISVGWGSNSAAFFEPHGINGGDPKVASIPLDFHLKTTSPLIDAGFTNTVSTNDFEGMPRPLGAEWEIGAFEYDSNLLVRLNFALATANSVPDATGNSHDALQMDATNRLGVIVGPHGTAGYFTNNGVMTNQYTSGVTYNKSQYLAVTNITGGLSNIVNGTIAFWVNWNTNYIGSQPEPERGARLLDAGDLVNFSTRSTNAWTFNYGWPDLGVTPAGLVFERWPTNDYFVQTNNVLAFWTNQTRFQTNWWHVAVTWTANTAFTAYENGVVYSTNTFPHPYLEVGGANPGWICVGALQHSGTPQWDFPDGQPNAGWFMGQMADVRIYNRVLSTNEVYALYNSTATPSGGSGPAPPSGGTFSAGTIRAGRVSKP